MAMDPIKHACTLLKAGKLVGLPTETVYGLGADARNPAALTQVFLAKERPFTHPLIVHLASIRQLPLWAKEIPPTVEALAQAFWPGPLTLILKKRPEVSELLTGGQESIGLRIPAHPVAQALLKAFGDGIAAPSANRYTRLSPTTAAAVTEELGAKVAYVLEGGTCKVGIESTILDLSRGPAVILRPGMISAASLSAVLKEEVFLTKVTSTRAPGMDQVHYAPETRVTLVDPDKLADFLAGLKSEDLPLAVLCQEKLALEQKGVQWIYMSKEPQGYAHELYLTLRGLDKQQFKNIVVLRLPATAAWAAIADRLEKAAAAR